MRFKYKDRVKVTLGFYRGMKATVIDVYRAGAWTKYWVYLVRFDDSTVGNLPAREESLVLIK